ncbi:MAG: tonB-dependent siderophore receptor family protein [Collimonas fungivorans]|uniref:TonB-dependent siderophore receptor n=1 Tax=Collimonas fungivorans TaxID=158899 RepID=UPI0026F17C0B|nr:TonB-dependent siderophore receptor [Collimonas fungivorans]MDB5766155.1 tonB-dependent siderophore receptor family protein [Collimonas fungivorans]
MTTTKRTYPVAGGLIALQTKKKLLITLIAAAIAGMAHAQSDPEQNSRTAAGAGQSAQPQNETTLPTVTVTGAGPAADSYRKTSASVANFGAASLLDTPAAVSIITRTQLDDQQARLLSDVVRNDAAVGNNYTPVGYYENFSIRGFPLDLATSLQINGMSIAGEQNVALENKESVEILNGLAGLQSGMTPPGGLINYVTKRPADVRSITLETDARGSRYLATDIGALFGEQKQFGLRINAAHESLHSYVNNADGERNFASLAADWIISPQARLQFDAEYQHREQRSAPGYQLLGGAVVPGNVSPSTLLGAQPWAKPVTINSVNLNTRLDLDLAPDWHAYVAASRSRVVIDDNSAFPYGCGYGATCGEGGTPARYFSASGDFDIYDYRFPDDTRRNDQLQAVLQGKLDTGKIHHDLTLGASMFRRTVSQSDGVNEYVGSDNIYNPNPIVYAPSPLTPDASYLRLDSRQKALFAVDRISLTPQWQVIAGARQVWLNERALDITGAATRTTEKSLLLPQVALVYKPQADLSLYTSYSKGLTMGGQAPFWAENAYAFLAPTVSRQVEAGVKYDWRDQLSLSAALFQMTKPYEYPKPDENGYTYTQQGSETHRGLELSAAGQVTRQLRLTASVALIQARADDTGTPAYDGHQAINVPRLRTALYASYTLPQVTGLTLLGGWQYSASKAATREGDVNVPAYSVFDAGLRYKTSLAGHPAVLRLSVDNLFDKRYWKDVGEYFGDSYLHLGAPRSARLSLQYDF